MPTSHPWNNYRPCSIVTGPSPEEQKYRMSLEVAQAFLTLRPGDTMEIVAHDPSKDGPLYTVTLKEPIND